MNRYIIILIVSVLCISCAATNKFHTSVEYLSLYQDNVSEGYKLLKTWRDYSVEENGDTLIYNQYEVESRQLYHRVYLKTIDLEKHGQETEWYSNGHLRFVGFNEDGKREGIWNFYSYKTGKLEEYGRYKKGKKEGFWTFVDSLGNKTATFSYSNDELYGNFQLYSKNGEVYKEGLYENGKLITSKQLLDVSSHPQEVKDKDFTLISCDNAKKQARTQCRKDNFNIAARIIADYPGFEEDRKVTGTALVYVEVNEQGKISDFEILRSLSPRFEEEILKLKDIEFIFEPAICDGNPCKSSTILNLAYFPPEGTFYYDPFMHNPQFFMPPPPNFTPPNF